MTRKLQLKKFKEEKKEFFGKPEWGI